MYKKVLILVAMPNEAEPIINTLKLNHIQGIISPVLPAKIYKSSFHPNKKNKKIFLAINKLCNRFNVPRVGTQASSLLAWEAIKNIQPDIAINAGTAGGFQSKGAKIGDVILSTDSIKYHDRDFHPTSNLFNQYAIGSYPCIDVTSFATKLNLKTGIISTGNTLHPSDQEKKRLIKNQASAKEMEAAAIAEVANLFNVPFLAVKIITDFVDSNICSQKQFEESFQCTTKKLANVLKEILNLI